MPLELKTNQDIRRLELYLRVFFYFRLLIGSLVLLSIWLLLVDVGTPAPFLIVVSLFTILALIHHRVLRSRAGPSACKPSAGFLLMIPVFFFGSFSLVTVGTPIEIAFILMVGPFALFSYVLMLSEANLCSVMLSIAEPFGAAGIAQVQVERIRYVQTIPGLLVKYAGAALVGLILVSSLYLAADWDTGGFALSILHPVPFLAFSSINLVFVWLAVANSLTLKALIGKLEQAVVEDLAGQDETP